MVERDDITSRDEATDETRVATSGAVDAEARWVGVPGLPHPGSPRPLVRRAFEHRADDIVDLRDAPDGRARTLGPEAESWAQSLLDVARFELARADDKANTMFRFYGVVAALSIGLLAGKGSSPTTMLLAPQVVFWVGAAALLASGVFLGTTLYPRDIRGTPAQRLLYFGHVIAYESVDELADALRSVEEDSGHRLVEQLLSVSRLVHKKYALMRKALLALGAGTFICIAALLLNVALRNI